MGDTAGTIVVGVDGSSASHQALVWAAAQAEAENRAITLVHVVPRSDANLPDPGLLADAHEEVRRWAPGVTVRHECVVGDPREALVDLSGTAALLVLGSRGRGHLKGLLLGSTAVAVVRHAHCPVLVHRAMERGPARHGIAVGADATQDSLPVLEFAFRQASLRHLPLTVVHSFWYFQQPLEGSMAPAEIHWGEPVNSPADERLRLAESLAGFAERYPDVVTHTVIDQGMPERHLSRLADHMDLLVVGVHHCTPAEQLMFGSVSVWLVEHATCPVAAVPLPEEMHR